MAKVTVMIDPVGCCQYLQAPEAVHLFQSYPKTIKRVSHVEPINILLRVAFRCLRICFGEYGKVAAWTRLWPCRWQVNFSPIGGKLFRVDENGNPFQGRRQAIDFEVRIAADYLERTNHGYASSFQEGERGDLHR